MDVTAQNTTANTAIDLGVKGAERTAALAEARSSASEARAREAAAARARGAEKLAETREAIARAVGANTRLSIERSGNASQFIYRAIDINTGEVINEWPEDKFLALVRSVRSDVQTDIEAKGLILDDLA